MANGRSAPRCGEHSVALHCGDATSNAEWDSGRVGIAAEGLWAEGLRKGTVCHRMRLATSSAASDDPAGRVFQAAGSVTDRSK